MRKNIYILFFLMSISLVIFSQTPNDPCGDIAARLRRVDLLIADNKYDDALEELEFTYIFELLNDMCVLYWIAFRQCGESDVNAICKMCDIMIQPLEHMDYTITKQVFQQLLIAPYMQKNYRKLPY